MIKNILINIAKTAINNKINENITVNSEINDELLEYLSYHQILPFIHHFKNTVINNFTFINDNVFFKSQEQHMKNLCRSMLYIDFLKKSSPPEFFLSKGFILGHHVYDNIGLRTFNDMDIFIEKKNYDKWIDFLKNNGFVKYENSSDIFPKDIILKYSFAQHFINPEKELAIDLHLNISNKMHPFQFQIDEFFQNEKTLTIDSIKFHTFSNEYQIIYLLYHCFKHYYFKLIWFIDIYRIFNRLDYKEQKVMQLLKQYKLENLMVFYIRIANDIFGNSGLPENSILLSHYKRRTKPYIDSDKILQGEFNTSNSLNRLIFPMIFLPNLKAKVKYLSHQFFPPMEILPENYFQQKNWKSYWYIKNRINRIKRLFQTN